MHHNDGYVGEFFSKKKPNKLLSFTVAELIELDRRTHHNLHLCLNLCTGGPHYMRSFYLRIHVYAIGKWPFFWNLSSNLQWSFVFLYANSLYASIFVESLSLAYNEVHLYCWSKHAICISLTTLRLRDCLILRLDRFSQLSQFPQKILPLQKWPKMTKT